MHPYPPLLKRHPEWENRNETGPAGARPVKCAKTGVLLCINIIFFWLFQGFFSVVSHHIPLRFMPWLTADIPVMTAP